ncbi:hypothetical protein ACH4ZX_15580 [Streptomyces sp. NPDC020490]|uniref:hypothetical protein n=1 Tax=Streptomyces sp. NPDC020490 TaxID=3365078 RepID=UPI0037B2F85B
MKARLVTGCPSGLGHALARRIPAEGDALVATARRPDILRTLVAQTPDRAVAVADQ